MINYMDRIALSIAAKPIAEEFHLTSVGMGYLFSSFIWSYALFLIPVGLLIDKFGVKRVGGFGIFIWSLATALTGAASSFASLLTARLVMGAGESVSNPVGAKVIREWIPSTERGMITAIFNSGSYAGPAICSLVLAALVAAFGWRMSFVIAGSIGFATGYVISATGSYNWAFGIVGGLLVTGALVILSMTRKPMIPKERLPSLVVIAVQAS